MKVKLAYDEPVFPGVQLLSELQVAVYSVESQREYACLLCFLECPRIFSQPWHVENNSEYWLHCDNHQLERNWK